MKKDHDTLLLTIQERLDALPPKPGVYQFKNAAGEILYVGKAINLRNRVRSYFQKSHQPDPRRSAMVSRIADIEIIVTDSEVEALILETNLIQSLTPRYNIDLKDDKSFPYIVITNEPYPRVFATRRVIRDGSRYFGPYTDVKNMHASLKLIRELYKVRSCNYFIDQSVIDKRKIRICFDYHIKKCEGPCEGLVSREHYKEMIEEVAQILRGKTGSLVRLLEGQMEQASQEMRYEAAAVLRDRILQLRVYSDRQKVVDSAETDRDIVAVAADGDDACGVVFKVREGKLIGRHHLYMSGVEGREERDVVEQFVERIYMTLDEIPPEIFFPVELEAMATVRAWLARRAGGPVDLVVPKIGEKAKLMAMCQRNAQYLLELLKFQKAKNREFVPASLRALQQDLRLTGVPRKIECFDISTIQGADTVASMVVFVDGKPRKSEYRKFKIATAGAPDDFAAMREVVRRRYTRVLDEHQELPDLVVVDGGKGQLSSAVETLESLGLRKSGGAGDAAASANLPVIGLAKRLEEVFVPAAPEAQSIPRSSPGLRLLQQVRDEAHRFAITYHRTVRSKRVLRTELDLIKGIGKKRAKDLLQVFGSVQGVKFATAEQLAELVGAKLASQIKSHFAADTGE